MTTPLAQLRRLQQTNLYAFARWCFHVLKPNKAFVAAPHMEAMCFALQEATTQDRGRHLITLPPRYGKSLVGSVALCAFILGRDPSQKIIVASYGADLAERQSRDFRAIVTHPEFRQIFPGFALSRNTALEVETTRGGGRKAISVGGAVTGFGCNLLIIDDLAKASDIHSEAQRQEVISFYDETLFSRLDEKDRSSIVAMGQRLAQADIGGHLLARGGFAHLNLPAIATERQRIPLYWGREFRRQLGDVLAPGYESRETLEQIRREMGDTAFSAQYQQNPVPPGGNRIRWSWFGNYDDQPMRTDFRYVVQSWDTGFSAETTSDFCVCITFGYRDKKWDIVDIYRRRLDYHELKGVAHALIGKWSPDAVIVEKAASGHSLVTDLRHELQHVAGRVLAYTPRDDKAVRVEVQNAKLEAGLVRVPVEASWLAAFRLELEAFPNGWNDDQVDALTQFLEWTATPRGQDHLVERHPVTGRPMGSKRPMGLRFR